MHTITSVAQARQALLAAVPEIGPLESAYRVTAGAPDDELVAALLEHLQGGEARLARAEASGDLAGIAGFAHGLKGMGGSVGLPEVSALGQLLESAATERRAGLVADLLRALRDWRRTAEPTA